MTGRTTHMPAIHALGAPGPGAAPSDRPPAGEALRFGAFPITETADYPPPRGPRCWCYLTLNAEIALSLPRRPLLQALVASPRARISVDGQWLLWALRRKYPQRPLAKLSGSDLIHALAAHCAAHGQRLLLLGSSPGANAGAVQRLRQRWPGLAVAGYSPSDFDTAGRRAQAVLAASLAAIQAQRADHVVLGLGAEKEQWLAWSLAPRLDGQVTGLHCFGGAIDLASGRVRRAPAAWQALGLEGAWRVLQQPGRALRLLRVLRILPVLWRRDY